MPAIMQGYYVAIEQTTLLQQTHVKPEVLHYSLFICINTLSYYITILLKTLYKIPYNYNYWRAL